jgi:3'-phosphoadenosine 5'-phosphosulfate (PAPS) 3'-phosphatase
MPAYSALLNVMIAAARKAGRALKRDFGEVEKLQVSMKGPANFVSAADRRAEETLYAELSRSRPGYGFLGEEGGVREGADKTHTWIVDPLDGTTNFLHGRRLALAERDVGTPEVGQSACNHGIGEALARGDADALVVEEGALAALGDE